MTKVVFDSSVVLAHLKREPGSDDVAAMLGRALISTVNLAEVTGKLMEWKLDLPTVKALLSRYGLEVIPFDGTQAHAAGAMRPLTKSLGLSLGDRACLALGQVLMLPVVTMDRAWEQLDLQVEIKLLR